MKHQCQTFEMIQLSSVKSDVIIPKPRFNARKNRNYGKKLKILIRLYNSEDGSKSNLKKIETTNITNKLLF